MVTFLNESDPSNESISEVPTKWLTEDKVHCYWPPGANANLYIKRLVEPRKSWPLHPVRVDAFHGLGCVLGDDGPTVKIPQGDIKGTYQRSYNGRTFSAFEGIPYAKPPVGELRFMEPEPADHWQGVLIANTTYMCMCFIPIPLLYGPRGIEDCLYVYVYVPREKINEDENLDVVVHIHGGAFMVGAPKYMASPSFIMDQDVIYVSFNYRLAIFGFLSTEDDVVPGNNGLKDQSLALKWIKENVKYFGGNPDSITLTGLSAGGSSVHYHYLSPWSKGLFHRGFSQSGTALQHWALTEEPLDKAKVVANQLNCSTESTKIMVECLKKVSATQLVWAMKSLFMFMDIIPFTTFGPVVEKGKNPFLADQPYNLLKEGKVYDVPWVVSNVKEEGIFPVGCVAHSDDGRLLFPIIGTPSELETNDEKMMKLLTGFATVYAKS
ncbi:hypothetical protein NQ314_003818, partial [Rhamnusium bicolor]